MKAFLTGSRVYGRPNGIGSENPSDIDLVLCAEPDAMLIVQQYADDSGSGNDEARRRGGVSVHYGLLNLLFVTEEDFPKWKQGTEELRARTPVTREEAVRHCKRLLGEED